MEWQWHSDGGMLIVVVPGGSAAAVAAAAVAAAAVPAAVVHSPLFTLACTHSPTPSRTRLCLSVLVIYVLCTY
jgi:hypothetical protein